jgi:hypothetical protein
MMAVENPLPKELFGDKAHSSAIPSDPMRLPAASGAGSVEA